MTSLNRAICWALLFLPLGCNSTEPGLEQRRDLNAWMLRSLSNSAIENATIAQHTIFPYHFVQDSATLNDLGRSDLAVLASHYLLAPGTLSIRRGDTSDSLYQARVKEVLTALADSKVEVDKMRIEDALPSGDGAPSDRVLNSLQEKKDQSFTSPSSYQSTSAPSSSTRGQGGVSMGGGVR